VSSVVALEFSVESPAGDSQHFRCSGFISIRECDGAADEFAFSLIERGNQENGAVGASSRARSSVPPTREQELGAGRRERDVAQLVDDQQLVTGELTLEAQQTLFIARFVQLLPSFATND
jgi:hypothetical protein